MPTFSGLLFRSLVAAIVLPIAFPAMASGTLAGAVVESDPFAATPPAPVAPRQPQQEEEPQETAQPPAPPDAIGGFQLSIIGATQLTGKSSLQVGGVASYFFRPKSAIGFEVEGGVTFGAGKVYHALASVLLQSGARTSRIVPYLAIGGGYVYSNLKLSDENRRALLDMGIVIDKRTESGPAVAFGGGVRYYFREGLSVRGDFRDIRVLRDDTGGESFLDRIYALRRIAAIVSFEF